MNDCYRTARTLVQQIATLLLLASFPVVAQAQGPFGVYLTWSDDPATTITVNWVDLYPDSLDVIHLRPLGTEAWVEHQGSSQTVEPSSIERHIVSLNNLTPDTTYELAIAAVPTKPEQIWRFRTMPADHQRSIKFVTGGDMMHSRERVDAMNRQVARLEPDFALLGGDLAYANGVDARRWIDWFESWTLAATAADRRLIPIVVAIGNHEVRGGYNGRVPDSAPYFYGFFTLPEDRSNYGLDFGNYLSLIVLDSGHTRSVDGEQAQWLPTALEARADQRFLFVCYHYPAYGTTKAPAGGLPIDATVAQAIRQHWVPSFERYGVSAIFENDHHNFKRSVRLLHHERNDELGLLYLGDGAWGVATREVPPAEVAWWLERAEPRNHLWAVELRIDGTATLNAIDREGVVFDTVELSQARTTPQPAAIPEAAAQ